MNDREAMNRVLAQTSGGLTGHVIMQETLAQLTQHSIGVAHWEIQIVRFLPQEFRGSLPTVEELEAELVGEEY